MPQSWCLFLLVQIRTIICIGCILTGLVDSAHAIGSTTKNTLTGEQQAYISALELLSDNKLSAFNTAVKKLAAYPLAPYLLYHKYRTRLGTTSSANIKAFLEQNADLTVADVLKKRWLKKLGARRRWQEFLDNYEEDGNTELRCYQLRAMYGTGQKDAALARTAELWVVKKSQPKSCDPLFDVWIDSEYFNDEHVWNRLVLVLEANQHQLARYIVKQFSASHREMGQRFYNVHANPNRLSSQSNYAADDRKTQQVIAHGLRRMSASNPDKANKTWQQYRKSHQFSAPLAQQLSEDIAVARAKKGNYPKDISRPSTQLLINLADAAVKQQRWHQVNHWIERMPDQQRNQERWQYWLARSLELTHENSQRAQKTFEALARRRHYYGFLAANRIGRAPVLNNNSSQISAEELNKFRQLDSVVRATELLAVGDRLNARREWYQLTANSSGRDLVLSAHFANEIGWYNQSIRAANGANIHDDISLRFPIVYKNAYSITSQATKVPMSFMLAITRQESAFDPKARSHANARGLMQLLPSTAKLVARRARKRIPKTKDLYDPSTNMDLAAHHLARLLTRYNNSRPVAAAAYNAGEGRADRWIKETANMPMDVWIETIPFKETRNYVKNIIAFSQVYGIRLGDRPPVLAPHETAVPKRA